MVLAGMSRVCEDERNCLMTLMLLSRRQMETIVVNSNGLQPTSGGLQPHSNGPLGLDLSIEHTIAIGTCFRLLPMFIAIGSSLAIFDQWHRQLIKVTLMRSCFLHSLPCGTPPPDCP